MLKTFEAHKSNYLQHQPKQQHFPEKKLPQMFQKTAKTTTNAGENSPAFAVKNNPT